MWFLSYVAANWALILVVVLTVASLGALAFFLKNWKAAVAALVVAGIGFAFQHIDKTAYQRRVDEENRAKIDLLQTRATIANEIADHYMEKAEADAAEIDRLKGLASNTPANGGACFDIDTTRRVRSVE